MAWLACYTPNGLVGVLHAEWLGWRATRRVAWLACYTPSGLVGVLHAEWFGWHATRRMVGWRATRRMVWLACYTPNIHFSLQMQTYVASIVHILLQLLFWNGLALTRLSRSVYNWLSG